MSVYFVDTSALGRRYLAEIGSTWARSWITPATGNIVVISEITTVEMLSVFARLQRQGKLRTPAVTHLNTSFLHHAKQEYLVVPLDETVTTKARTLITKYPLRTLDAIQLASVLNAIAILSEPMLFVSGDNDLLAAATAEGLSVDNPYNYP